MAQYPNLLIIHFLTHVPNFVLLSQSARFFTMPPHYDEIFQRDETFVNKLKWPFCLSSLADGLAVNYSTRHNFFTIQIINLWNNLPESIISVDSVSLFKKKLNDH